MDEDPIDYYLQAKINSQLSAAVLSTGGKGEAFLHQSRNRSSQPAIGTTIDAVICGNEGCSLPSDSQRERSKFLDNTVDYMKKVNLEAQNGENYGMIDIFLQGSVQRPRKKEFVSQIASSSESEPHRKSTSPTTLQTNPKRSDQALERREQRRKTIHHEYRRKESYGRASSDLF